MTADLPRYPGPRKGLTAAARVTLSNSEQRDGWQWMPGAAYSEVPR